jgi:glycosyltransferase involved in cell wall biosynthesis
VTRALIASRTFTPEVNAAAFRLGALARALARRPHDEVLVITTHTAPHAPETADPSGVTVDRWPVLRDAGGNVRGYLQYASFDVPLLVRILFRRWDVAVAESPPTTGVVVAVSAALRRRPYAYYAADVWTDGVISMGAPAPVVAIMRMLERFALRRAAAILSVSEEVTERLERLGADPDRVHVVGNGIDTEVFSP